MLSAAGEVDGVLYLTHSLSWLIAALANIDFPRGAVLVVTDREGTILARLPNDPGWVGKTLREHDVIQALTAQPRGGAFVSDDVNGVRTLWAHAPLIDKQALHATIGVPETVAFADINRRLFRNLAGFCIVTLVAVTAAWFGARRFIFRQVDELVAASRKLASGNLAARTAVLAGRSELGVLARAFNSMAETLEARDRELRVAEERTRKVEVELAVTRAEIDIAREIQRCLLPEDTLAIAGVKVAGRCIPAVGVGGDYFGYFPQGGERIDNFIGDVSGHGVGAAMLMAEARTIFLAERLVEVSAAPIMSKLNDLLYEDLGRANHFMSACCATFDTINRELKYANAGHPPALILRADETFCGTLDADGMLLGMDKAVRFTEATVTLGSGDIVVFYTDGITERENAEGEFFGIERLKKVVIAHRKDDPEALIASVLSAADDFAGSRPNEDDVTIVVMRVM
jgi:serine phosphatase RsbU (regulator of sigma subunit)